MGGREWGMLMVGVLMALYLTYGAVLALDVGGRLKGRSSQINDILEDMR